MVTDFFDLFDKPKHSNGTNGTANGHHEDRFGHRVLAGTSTPYGETALNYEIGDLLQAPEGTRNDALNTAGFKLAQLVAGGELTHSDVEQSLTMTAHTIGLDDAEIVATIRSSMTAGLLLPRNAPEGRTTAPVTVTPGTAADPAVGGFWASRHTLQTLHDWAKARRVSPWAVLGVALARVVAVTDRRIVIPPIVGGIASLNFFVGIVGFSGDGKGGAEDVAAEALQVGPLVTHRPGSGEGIAHAYMRRVKGGDLEQHETNCLFSITEIDALAALGSRQSSTLMPELRSAWSGEALGFAYSDPAKRMPVPKQNYRLCLITGIQPGRAGALLDDTDGGTPQRFLWLPATDADAPDQRPDAPKPIIWRHPPFGMTHIDKHRVDVCRLAVDLIDSARLARLRGKGDALDGHALLARLKTAVALALLEQRLNVDEEDWRLAGIVQGVSDGTRASVAAVLAEKIRVSNEAKAAAEADRSVVVSERLAEAATKRVCRRLVRHAAEAGPDGILHNDLRHRFAFRDRATFDEAVALALRTGQVDVVDTEHGTRYTVPS